MNVKDRLLKKTNMHENGCWMFVGCWNRDGYGNMRVNGKVESTHRISYEVFIGPIPKDMSVLHTCDNRCCINPEHLFLGTQLDNVHDMIKKNRHRFSNPKLTQEQVNEIRKQLASGATQTQLGLMYGVTSNAIWMIENNITWACEVTK